jgi:hypothetical protein
LFYLCFSVTGQESNSGIRKWVLKFRYFDHSLEDSNRANKTNHSYLASPIEDSRKEVVTIVVSFSFKTGNTPLVSLLLKQGARVDLCAPAPEPDRASPLDLAILRGDPNLVRNLLEAGANVNRCSPIIGVFLE